MIQSNILKAGYEAIYNNLAELGEKTELFLITSEGLCDLKDDLRSLVCLGVSDVCQLCPDKNGEKVEVGEMIFEVPARIGCMFFLTVVSRCYPQLLETAGLLIQYFKDNNVIMLEGYKCHGDSEGKIVIESVIRKPKSNWEFGVNNLPVVTLEYYVEFGINSLKGIPFKRVEKLEIKGNIIGDGKK